MADRDPGRVSAEVDWREVARLVLTSREMDRIEEQELVPAKEVLAKKPEYLIECAVAGMLPKNPTGKRLMTKLKVYTGDKHPHAAQLPKKLEV